ncbi:MAG: protein TolQ [Deltaproteobacteria bacterium]|nr:MAG: protein TolQ [Deltaproteobacteria bacterium]
MEATFFWLSILGAGGNPRGGILDLVWEAGPVVKLVLLILFILSLFTWAIIFYKFRTVRRARAESKRFLEVFWESKKLDSIYETSQELDWSPVAAVFSAGYQELVRLKKVNPGSSSAGEAADHESGGLGNINRAMQKATMSEINLLERFLTFLATTGSAAPFIGLFGTVWGIMDSFRSIGVMGSANLTIVAPGISEALIATAMGLFAAIPAVMAYNFFVNQIKTLVNEMDIFSSEFLNIVERHFL